MTNEKTRVTRKTFTLGKVKGSRTTGRPNMRRTDSIKEASVFSLQDLSEAVNNSMF